MALHPPPDPAHNPADCPRPRIGAGGTALHRGGHGCRFALSQRLLRRWPCSPGRSCPTGEFLVDKWVEDPQYSHGFLVPLFSLYLLRQAHQAGRLSTSTPWPVTGSVLLALLVVPRFLAGGLMFHQLDCLALARRRSWR